MKWLAYTFNLQLTLIIVLSISSTTSVRFSGQKQSKDLPVEEDNDLDTINRWSKIIDVPFSWPTPDHTLDQEDQTLGIAEYERLLDDCQLSIYNETFDKMLNFITKVTPIVHLHLRFDNMTQFYSKTSYLGTSTHYIDPLTWTWASGDRGNALLGFPAIFVPMSIWTLSPDVSEMPFLISTEFCPLFLNFTDEQKQTVVATLLLDVLQASYYAIEEPPVRSDFKVCQEIAHNPFNLGDTTWLAVFFNLYFVEYNTKQECWIKPNIEDGTLFRRMYVSPVWLLYPMIILGIAVAILFPLLFVDVVK